MALKCFVRTVWLVPGVGAKGLCDCSPICAIPIGIEQPQISGQVLLIVHRECRVSWSDVCDSRVQKFRS
jgi:hypothetical protein